MPYFFMPHINRRVILPLVACCLLFVNVYQSWLGHFHPSYVYPSYFYLGHALMGLE